MHDTVRYGAVRPTLFIGLGGTGKEVLLRLRRRFYEEFGVPSLPCTAFLWIDADIRDTMATGEPMDEIYREVGFAERERVDLLRESPGTDLADVFRNRDRYAYIHRWLYPEVERFGQQISDGAGNVRAVGRLTWFHKFCQIQDRICELANEVLTVTSIEQTRREFAKRGGIPEFDSARGVVVAFSLAGGTGAGTFLDTAFLLRSLRALQFDQTVGICVMPNVFFPDRHDGVSERGYANAYAALKELEYFTVRRQPSESLGDCETFDYQVQWEPGRELAIPGPPFSMVYMLERNNEQGVGFTSKAAFFKMVAESLYMDFMPGEFSTRKRAMSAVIKSILVSSAEGSARVEGSALQQVFSRRYASFGLGKVEIPVEALKGACAAMLAGDIAVFWTRTCENNPDILGDVNRDLAEYQLTLDSLAGRFLCGWRESVRREIQRAIDPLTANPRGAKEVDVEQVRRALGAVEDRIVGAQGTGKPDSENNLPHRFAVDARRIVEEVRESLKKWIGVCLEDPSRGPRGLLMIGDQAGGRKGYLQLMKERLRQTYISDMSECMTRRQEAQQYAERWRDKCSQALAELCSAVSHRWVNVIDRTGQAVNHWVGKLQQAEEQYIIRTAEVALYDRCRYVAGEAESFLNEKTADLQDFMKAVEGLFQPFRDRRDSLLRPGQNVPFIQVYDETEDWPKFYRLDNGVVSAAVESKRLLGTRTLHDVYDGWRELGIEHLRGMLQQYAEKRFADDFVAYPRQVDIMQHPRLRGTEDIKRMAVQLVSVAFSRVRLNADSGQRGQTMRSAFLGTPDGGADRGREFAGHVKDALAAQGYSDPFVLDTGDRSAIYLSTVNYAFPLAMMDTVTGDCHDAYYAFYRDLWRYKAGSKAFCKVPLHIDRRWEGRFDDLVWKSDEEALRHKEALEIMLFGPILGVTYRRRRVGESGLVVHGYRQRHLDQLVDSDWGGRGEALDALRNDSGMRKQFLDEIRKREADLDPEKLRAYSYALTYASLLPVFGEGTVEHSLLVNRYNDLERAYQNKNVVIKDIPADVATNMTELWHWVRAETAGLVDWPEGSEVPVLSNLESWVYPPEEA